MSDTRASSIFNAVVSYVPALVVRRFMAYVEPQVAPAMDTIPAAVLFADVSGFTALAEQLAKQGPSGAEDLTHILNGYFSELIELINAYGGEVVKFAGDAVMSFWPAIDEDIEACGLRAGECALAIQTALNEHQATPDIRLSQRIAIDAGTVRATFVGGVYGRWEMLLSGEPILGIGQILHLVQPGEVVVSNRCWEMLEGSCLGEVLGDAVRLTQVNGRLARRQTVAPKPSAEVEKALWFYIPNAVRGRLAAGQTAWLSELRRVGIIFLNLPDLDPGRSETLEQTQAIMRALQTALYRYEGSINKLAVDDKGATLLAVLGLPPLSHEDDPRRAVLAALDMQSALQTLGVRASIGVASGVVLCGEVGSDVRREYTVMGDCVNLAARLMQAATDDLLCDAETFKTTRSSFTFDELGPLNVKGKSEPVAVYRPLERLASTSTELPTVGRSSEVKRLDQRLEALLNGETSLVLIEGEPGIGKSRVMSDLLREARIRGVTTLVRVGDATERSTPYYAWRPIFAQLFDIEVLKDAEQVREHILAQLEFAPELVELAPLLSAVLPIELPETPVTAQLAGSTRSAKTIELLVHLLQDVAETGAASGRPLLLAIEDAHWLDSASWVLVEHVKAEVSPLLLVVASRPLVDKPPPEYRQLLLAPQLHHMVLSGLDDEATETLVKQCLGADAVPDTLIRFITQRAQGNPFFSQELAYSLRDTGIVRIEDGSCHLQHDLGDLSQIGFPSTIQGVITSRIDRMAPEQQLLLKVAGVFGSTFRRDIVHDIFPIDMGTALDDHLAALQSHDFITRETSDGDVVYRFRQGLTREVAYNLLLFSQRRDLHQAIARWYEEREPHEIWNRLELLAWHWSGAGDHDKAATYYERSGDQAFRAGAYQEALKFFGHGLEHAQTAGQQGRLHRKVGAVLWERGERSAAERELKDGLATLEAAPLEIETAHIFEMLGRFAFRQGNNDEALDWERRALELSEQIGLGQGQSFAVEAAAVAANAYNTMAAVLARTGMALEATQMAEQAIELALANDLPEVACRAYTNLGVLYSAQNPEKAIEASTAGLELALRVGHLPLQSWLYANLAGAFCTFTGRCEVDGLAAAKRAVQLDRQLGQIDHLAVPLIVLGQIYQCNGSNAPAMQCFQEALVLAEQMHDPQLLFPCYDGLASACFEMGDEEQGEAYLIKSQELCEHAGLDPNSLVILPFLC